MRINLFKSAGDLFDPRNATLASMLDPAVHFPAEPFASRPQLLASLQKLGLQTQPSLPAALVAARCLGGTSAADDAAGSTAITSNDAQAARGRADALLRQLNALADRTLESGYSAEESEQWQSLRDISWCPTVFEPLEQGMPWLPPAAAAGSGAVGLAPPAQVCLLADAWLAAGALRVLHGPCQAALAALMGWNRALTPPVLAAQLAALGHAFPAPLHPGAPRAFATAASTPSEEGAAQVEEDPEASQPDESAVAGEGEASGEEGRSAVQPPAAAASVAGSAALQKAADATHRIYALLQAALADGWDPSTGHRGALLAPPLAGARTVWVRTGMAEPRLVAAQGTRLFAPYLHVLPRQLDEFRPLMAALGVAERCVDAVIALHCDVILLNASLSGSDLMLQYVLWRGLTSHHVCDHPQDRCFCNIGHHYILSVTVS